MSLRETASVCDNLSSSARNGSGTLIVIVLLIPTPFSLCNRISYRQEGFKKFIWSLKILIFIRPGYEGQASLPKYKAHSKTALQKEQTFLDIIRDLRLTLIAERGSAFSGSSDYSIYHFVGSFPFEYRAEQSAPEVLGAASA